LIRNLRGFVTLMAFGSAATDALRQVTRADEPLAIKDSEAGQVELLAPWQDDCFIRVPSDQEPSTSRGTDGTTVGVVGSDNRVKLKKVKIGKDLGTHLEITEGLSPEDRVILNPSDSLASR
jgi:hypothetical protein